MKKINLFIHPGYGKAGTTLLQNEIFSKIDFTNLGKPFYKNDLKEAGYKVFVPKYDFNPIYPFNVQNDLKNYIIKLEDEIDRSTNINFILSDEVIFDRINYFGDYNIYLLKEIIEKLKEKYILNLKFILTIRRQSDIVAPAFAYNYHRHKKNFGSLDKFIEKIISEKNLSQIYCYDELVLKIIKIFNSDIMILPIEELSLNFDEYVKKLENYLNISLKNLNFKNKFTNKNHLIKDGEKVWNAKDLEISNTYKLVRKIHLWLKNFKLYENYHKKLGFIKKVFLPKEKKVGYIMISAHQKKILEKHFEQSNKNLEKIIKINLKQFEYYK